MLHKLQRRARDEKGFTLIELLVVILIIGILAAIAIPAFLGQRARAQDTSAKSAARQAQTAIETFGTDNGGKYTGADKAALQNIEESLKSTPGTTLAVSGVSDTGYTLTVTSDTTNTFTVVKTAGAVDRTCVAKDTKGGCKSDGKW